MGDEQWPDKIRDVPTPCLLVNIKKVRQNAQTMIDRCQSLGVQLRPHMKTHKCLEIGEIATGYTKRCIVVSTLKEAEVFADGGFDDIVYGQLFTEDKMSRLGRLASTLSSFHVFVDSDSGIQLLEDNKLPDRRWSVLVKVDTGSSRAGVMWDGNRGLELARRLSSSAACSFHGIYCHEGQSYSSKDAGDIDQFSSQAAERILHLAKRLKEAGIECKSVGVGSTPTASRPSEAMKHLTELHPGNYLFYDAQQYLMGSCGIDDVAALIATRVIGQYPHRNQLLIDAGWTAVSLDGQNGIPDGKYCLVVDHPNLRLVKMTQEVGFLEPVKGEMDFENFPIGKLLFLMPYHSCATACMHDRYYICEGDNIIDVYKPCRGW